MNAGAPRAAEPRPTPVTAPFWEGTRAGELRLQRCSGCSGYVFYPRIRCPHCGDDQLRWVRASGQAPGWTGEVPYVIAIVELDEGPRMMTNLVDVAPVPEALPLDLPLEVVFVPRGDQVLPLFRPAGRGPR